MEGEQLVTQRRSSCNMEGEQIVTCIPSMFMNINYYHLLVSNTWPVSSWDWEAETARWTANSSSPLTRHPVSTLGRIATKGIHTIFFHAIFSPSTDDDNRIRIKPFPRRPDCSHDYINASYISVSGVDPCISVM